MFHGVLMLKKEKKWKICLERFSWFVYNILNNFRKKSGNTKEVK
jgi:hypothetical protein